MDILYIGLIIFFLLAIIIIAFVMDKEDMENK